MAVKLNEMEKKQTACSWLIEQITSLDITNISDEQWFGIIGEAKQLEKNQIIDGVYAGYNYDGSRLEEYSEQYYTETYESPQRDRSGKA